ncbi:MAG: hypothetical protein ACK5XD_00450, partial [Acidobacteriota bacterium]
MLLSSSTYFLFLAALFLIYWPLSRWRAASLATLLFANYFFYAKWALFYLFLIPLASTCDFSIGLGLDRFDLPALRRLLVSLSLLLHLGRRTAFKYMPFLFENYARLSG